MQFYCSISFKTTINPIIEDINDEDSHMMFRKLKNVCILAFGIGISDSC